MFEPSTETDTFEQFDRLAAHFAQGHTPQQQRHGHVFGDPPGDIIEITIFSGSLYAVCFFPALLFGLHWLRGSASAVLASMTLGVVVLIGWLLLGWGAHVHEVFPALLVSCMTYLLVARVTTDAIKRWPDTSGAPQRTS